MDVVLSLVWEGGGRGREDKQINQWSISQSHGPAVAGFGTYQMEEDFMAKMMEFVR